MSALTRPRGRHPARVYWVRRTLVLAVALGLVYGIAHLLGGGGGGTPAARTAGSVIAPHHHPAVPVATPSGSGGAHARTHASGSQPSATSLAVPTGPCKDSDISVSPQVAGKAYAGRTVTFRLKLTTLTSPACTWSLSGRDLVVKVVSGQDGIWSTQDCPSVIPPQDVIVRQGLFSSVFVKWNGQRSEGSCSRSTPWAQPGYYHVIAASIGANPSDTQFALMRPVPRTITPSPKPRHHPSSSPSASPSHG